MNNDFLLIYHFLINQLLSMLDNPVYKKLLMFYRVGSMSPYFIMERIPMKLSMKDQIATKYLMHTFVVFFFPICSFWF